MNNLDIVANRRMQKWTLAEKAGRVAWALTSPFFALSPRPLWIWRRILLRLFGAQIGQQVHIYPSAKITIPWNLTVADQSAIGDGVILYALGPILIGSRVTISQRAHICAGTHDWRDPAMPLVKLPVQIGDDAWICADTFVGPGVTIGRRAILGARGVAVRDIGDSVISAGNPSRQIGMRK